MRTVLPAEELDSGATVVARDRRAGAGIGEGEANVPDLDQIATKEDLAVISDEGAVYLNDRAWIMVLYAMVEYRDWTARLTHPLLMPLARQAFAALSTNRHFISSMLSPDNTGALANELRKEELGACAVTPAGAQMSTVREYLQ